METLTAHQIGLPQPCRGDLTVLLDDLTEQPVIGRKPIVCEALGLTGPATPGGTADQATGEPGP